MFVYISFHLIEKVKSKGKVMNRGLRRLKWLPCLHFSLLRRSCEDQVKDALLLSRSASWKPLVTAAESEAIGEAIQVFKDQFPEPWL